MADKNTPAARVAKVIRVITAPPFMIALLIIFLTANGFFSSQRDAAAAWLGLVILPVASYPVHRAVPSLYKTGREGQRKLAFVFTLIGYTLCFVYSFFSESQEARFLFSVYFATALILTLVNKLLHIRASGHTASSVSPCVFALMYLSLGSFIIFAALFLISVWASLYLKRHKLTDVFAGVCSFFAAFGACFLAEAVSLK